MRGKATITIEDEAYKLIRMIPAEAGLTKMTLDLLKAIEELCKAEPKFTESDPVILEKDNIRETLSRITGRVISKASFSNALKILKNDGVLLTHPKEEHKKKPHHHVIKSFEIYFQAKSERVPTKSSGNKSVGNEFKSEIEKFSRASEMGGLPIKTPDLEYTVQDIHLNGLFDRVMQYGELDEKLHSLSDTITFAHMPLGITASSTTEPLMGIADQRLVRPLLAYCRLSITESLRMMPEGSDRKPPNLFVISEFDICKMLGHSVARKEYREVGVRILRRIANVVFDIDASKNHTFRKVMSFNKNAETERIRMRIISNFDEGDNENGRFFYFSLDERLYISMLSRNREPQFFRALNSLSREISDTIHAIHNWVRRKASSKRPNVLWDVALAPKDIHMEVMPKLDGKAFSFYLSSSLDKFQVWEAEGIKRYIFHGIEAEKDTNGFRHKYRFRVNPNDDIMGQEVLKLAQENTREGQKKSAEIIKDWRPESDDVEYLIGVGLDTYQLEIYTFSFKEYWSGATYLPKDLGARFRDHALKNFNWDNNNSTRKKVLSSEFDNDTSWAAGLGKYENGSLFNSEEIENAEFTEFDGSTLTPGGVKPGN